MRRSPATGLAAAFGLVIALLLGVLAPSAAAAGTFRGQVSVSYATDFSVGSPFGIPGAHRVERGSLTYRAITPQASSDPRAVSYDADVTLRFDHQYFDRCDVGQPVILIDEFGVGLSASSTTPPSDTLVFGGGAFTLIEGDDGRFRFDPSQITVVFKPGTVSGCGYPWGDLTYGVRGAGFFAEFAQPQAATRPLNDDDPSADHLVGATTFTIANPPYDLPPSLAADLRDFTYTVTYDLLRSAGECSDGIGNGDFDGLDDYPADPGCTSADDPSELGAAQCDNGKDDDGNGLTDMLDRIGCSSPTDPGEGLCADLPRKAGLKADWRPWTRTLDLSANPGGPGVRYRWTFGDGSTRTTATATQAHTYRNPGKVRVRVRVSIPSRPKCKALTSTREIVVDPIDHYAPTIRFDERERYFGGEPADFIRASSLMVATHRDLARGRCKPDIETVVARGALSAGRLSGLTGSPYEASVLTRGACETLAIRSNDPPDVVSQIEALDHGFFLNAANDASLERGSLGAPVYAEWFDPVGKSPYVVYWLWYPHNAWETSPSINAVTGTTIRELHEGDWEHVVLQVDQDDNTAKRVGFYQHYCSAEKIAYGSLEKDSSSHFVVYAARGGHASYPSTPGIRRGQLPSCASSGNPGKLGVDWTAGGKTWRPWKGKPIRDAQRTPWYGFGGAWGDQDPRSTGPLEGPIQNYGPPGPGPARSVTVDGTEAGTVPRGWR